MPPSPPPFTHLDSPVSVGRQAAKAHRIRLFLFLAVSLLIAGPAHAQHDARIGVSLSSAFGDGGPAPVVAASASFPAFSRLRLEVEASFVRRLDFGTYFSCPPGLFCAAVVSFPFTLTGDATSLGGNVVAELPWRTRRIRPYALAGAGVAHVRRERRETRFNGSTTATTLSSTAPLVTAGGGVEFFVGERFVVGADARYQRMYEKDQFHRSDIPPNLDLLRVGSSVGYRF